MELISCPICSSRLNLPRSAVGQDVKCPRCATTFVASLDSAQDTGWPTYNTGRAPQRMSYTWAEGDRALAFWEENWMYPGTIRCIDDDVVFIKFDDGDRALVPLGDLEPIRVRKGDKVYARRDQGPKMYEPATVVRSSGEEVVVRYEDGDEETTTVSFLRFLRQ